LKGKHTYHIHFLLLLLACTWVLYLIYPLHYAISKIEIKNEQHEAIKGNAELAELNISEEIFFQCYDNADKELRLNGNMYDVESYTMQNGIVICKVLQDKKETKLDSDFSKHIKNQSSDKQAKQFLFWSPVFCNAFEYFNLPMQFNCVKEFPSFENHLKIDGYYASLKRPPKQCQASPLALSLPFTI